MTLLFSCAVYQGEFPAAPSSSGGATSGGGASGGAAPSQPSPSALSSAMSRSARDAMMDDFRTAQVMRDRHTGEGRAGTYQNQHS